MKLLILASILFINIFAVSLEDAQIIKIVLNSTNTRKISPSKFSSVYKEFWWQPNRKFLRRLPREVAKNLRMLRISLFDKFISKDKSRLNTLFYISYDSCHNCSPYILTASISLKDKKVVLPLSYVTYGGTFGQPPKAEHIGGFDAVFLHSSFTAQGFITFDTQLIYFSKNGTKKVFDIVKNGQISKCNIKKVSSNSLVDTILNKVLKSRKHYILKSYDNSRLQEDGTYIFYPSSFCDIFLKKMKNNGTDISVYFTTFLKTQKKITSISRASPHYFKVKKSR